MTLLISLVAVCFLLVLGGLWVLSGAPMPAIPPERTAAPEGFDASAYVDIAALSSTEQGTVLRINDFGRPFEHHMITDLAVTYFTMFAGDERRRVIFVDDQGTVIGDITDQPQLFPMGQFMVTLDSYYVISRDSVSTRQPIVDRVVAAPNELAQMIARSTHYRSYSGTDLPDNDLAAGVNTRLHVMRLDGVWTRVATDDATFYEWKGVPFDRLDAQYRIPRPADTVTAAPDFFGGRYRIELTHFDQREFLPERGAPIGSPTGQGRLAQWTGTGYYTVFIDEAPALRFRIENDREVLSGSRSISLTIHGGAALDFIVIEQADPRGDKQVFVVRRAT
ncbi:hypothetical protein LCM17_02125 [Cereibacter sphaeroides]|nr:hypothetical protein [Cereibacter sphaeroides]